MEKLTSKQIDKDISLLNEAITLLTDFHNMLCDVIGWGWFIPDLLIEFKREWENLFYWRTLEEIMESTATSFEYFMLRLRLESLPIALDVELSLGNIDIVDFIGGAVDSSIEVALNMLNNPERANLRVHPKYEEILIRFTELEIKVSGLRKLINK